MAMQAGMGVSRLVVLLGASCTGAVLYKNGKLSDVFAELQKLLSNEDAESDVSAQLRRLKDELQRVSPSRPIILNGTSGQNALSLVVPAAAVGALGYGYMWWKGISFSDLMYVTKRGMATAVENLTKRLEHVSDAITEAKKHLTQRIENLDDKLDEQVEMSKLIRSDVNDVRGDLSLINLDMDELQKMVSGLGDKLLTMEEKQDMANVGVLYLCSFANGQRVKMPERLQEHLKVVGNSVPGLMGLKELETLELGTGDSRGGMEKANDLKPRSLTRFLRIVVTKEKNSIHGSCGLDSPQRRAFALFISIVWSRLSLSTDCPPEAKVTPNKALQHHMCIVRVYV